MIPNEKALEIADALTDKKALDVRILDLAGVSSFTDYFVIASGSSTRHVKTLAEETTRAVREQGEKTLGVEGDPPGRWVLVDAGDVVVHLFEPEAREFYALERLWGEAEQLELPSEPGSDVAEAAR